MKHATFIATICCNILFLICDPVLGKSPESIPNFLTAGEQALLLDASTKPTKIDLSDGWRHVDRAAKRLQIIDLMPGSYGRWQKQGGFDLFPSKGDRLRKGNKPFKMVLYELTMAKASGVDPETALSSIYGGKSMLPAPLAEERKNSLLNAMKSVEKYGLDTPESLDLLKDGKASVVTKGNPKYRGKIFEVDHRVALVNASKFENDVANFRIVPWAVNRAKLANHGPIESAHVERLSRIYWATNASAATADIGFGFLVLYHEAPETLHSIEKLLNPETKTLGEGLRFGEHAGFDLLGAGQIISGGARMSAYFSRLPSTITRFESISRFGNKAGLIGLGVGEGFAITEWQTGELNNREFYTMQGGMIGGFGGAFAGAEAGAFIGSIGGPPGVAIGGLIGGIGGAFAGAALGNHVITSCYSKLDENQKNQIQASIYTSYGL